MRASDDPVRHDNRLGSRLGDEGQNFFRNSVIGADVGLPLGKPASKVGSLGALGRHNADRELGCKPIIWAVERDSREGPAAESLLGLLVQVTFRVRLPQPNAVRGSTRPADGQNDSLILSTRRGALHFEG
jgi:hypothetical protein